MVKSQIVEKECPVCKHTATLGVSKAAISGENKNMYIGICENCGNAYACRIEYFEENV